MREGREGGEGGGGRGEGGRGGGREGGRGRREGKEGGRERGGSVSYSCLPLHMHITLLSNLTESVGSGGLSMTD